jgi:hypothetical protein
MPTETKAADRYVLAAELRLMAARFKARGSQWENDEERAKFESLEAQYDAQEPPFDTRSLLSVNHGGRVPGLEDTEGRRPIGEDASGLDAALSGWVRNAFGQRVTERDSQACERYGVALNASTFEINFPTSAPCSGRDWQIARETRALSFGSIV